MLSCCFGALYYTHIVAPRTPSSYGVIRDKLRMSPSVNAIQRSPFRPLGPLGFNSPNIAQRHALHVERTAEKAFMLSDRV